MEMFRGSIQCFLILAIVTIVMVEVNCDTRLMDILRRNQISKRSKPFWCAGLNEECYGWCKKSSKRVAKRRRLSCSSRTCCPDLGCIYNVCRS
ncbi:hypothetical protein Btru_055181 [Bulinus truncatus]|nr:hypothetical protein Btru_055181 [Bulinus truncatus]